MAQKLWVPEILFYQSWDGVYSYYFTVPLLRPCATHHDQVQLVSSSLPGLQSPWCTSQNPWDSACPQNLPTAWWQDWLITAVGGEGFELVCSRLFEFIATKKKKNPETQFTAGSLTLRIRMVGKSFDYIWFSSSHLKKKTPFNVKRKFYKPFTSSNVTRDNLLSFHLWGQRPLSR